MSGSRIPALIIKLRRIRAISDKKTTTPNASVVGIVKIRIKLSSLATRVFSPPSKAGGAIYCRIAENTINLLMYGPCGTWTRASQFVKLFRSRRLVFRLCSPTVGGCVFFLRVADLRPTVPACQSRADKLRLRQSDMSETKHAPTLLT